jgi:3-isopropylmalate/(R)-2-methylmalate dehydratase small subunit
MEPFARFVSHAVALPMDNIDTDQIYPGRFLRVTTRDGLDKMLFADWRFDAAGNPRPDFVLNQPQAAGARILVAGDNFGSGSSREHAPWALMAYGFRAVVSTSFADIFRNNALKNGLLPIVLDAESYRQVLVAVTADPLTKIEVDLARQSIQVYDGPCAGFPIDAFSKRCLLAGVDEMGYLLSMAPAIAAYEATHPARVNTVTGRN